MAFERLVAGRDVERSRQLGDSFWRPEAELCGVCVGAGGEGEHVWCAEEQEEELGDL